MKKQTILIVVAVLIIIIDQWTKVAVSSNFYVGESVRVIDGFFNLTYVRNPGAAFGFGGEFSNWIRYSIFRALPSFVCIYLAYKLIKPGKDHVVLSTAYSLILGGAVGNLIDRFRLDYVVDFFDFYIGKNHFATFNVADASISIAAGLLILELIITKKQEDKKEQA